MRAVKSVSIDSERRVIITYLDGSTETLYPNCIWCDSEALRQLIKDLLEEKADAITQTIENVTVATFADGADEGVIKKLLVSIDPIQEGEGDPSPENVRPISGRTGLNLTKSGKNLIPTPYQSAGGGATTINGVTFTPHEDGSIMIDGTASSNAIYYIRSAKMALPLKAGTYTLKGIPNGSLNTLSFRVYTANGTIGYARDADYAFTLDHSEVISLSLYVYNGYTANNEVIKPMLVYGSTATDYEPYKGSTHSVNWETEAGTVYGGYVDVVSGKLTVDRAMITFDGTQPIGLANWRPNESSVAWLYAYSVTPGIKTFDSGNVVPNIISDRIKTTQYGGSSGVYDGMFDCISVVTGGAAWGIAIRVSDTSLTTASAISAWLAGNPVTVVYELATPTEIQLTPQEVRTLLGVNNIWADSGNIMELIYTADTKLYIGEQEGGALGSNKQTVTKPDIQPVTYKTREETNEEVKEE